MARKALTVIEGKRQSALAEMVEEYLTSDPTWSRRTRDQYAYNLTKVFLPWAEDVGLTRPDQLDDKALTALHRHLAQDRQPSTVHSYLRSVNQMLNWARKGKVAGVSESKAKLPTLKRQVLDVLSREEINRLEGACGLERDKLIVRLMADCGLRLDETLHLTASDLQRQGKAYLVRVRSASRGGGAKGGNERLVPVPAALYTRLRKYVDHGRRSEATTSRIFTTDRRHADGTYSALEPRTVQNMVKSAAERAGIEKRVHPHLLRHSYATHMLDRGINPVVLQGNLGHADLDMIARVYSHLTAGQRFEASMAAMYQEDE
jgi:integrase/recombinase XerD